MMLQIVVEVSGTVCDADVQYSLKQLSNIVVGTLPDIRIAAAGHFKAFSSSIRLYKNVSIQS